MKLYKFSRSYFVKGLLEQGKIRLGTIRDFRHSAYGSKIGDPRDGLGVYNFDPQNLKAGAVAPVLGALFDENVIVSAQGMHIDFGDAYIFSASGDYDRDAHVLWLKDEYAKYDACYSIDSPDAFFSAITDHLCNIGIEVSFLGWKVTHYYDDEVGLKPDSPEAWIDHRFLKGKNYGDQIEYRAAWAPLKDGIIKPRNIEVPGLGQYCSLVTTLKPEEYNLEKSWCEPPPPVVAAPGLNTLTDHELANKLRAFSEDLFKLNKAWEEHSDAYYDVHWKYTCNRTPIPAELENNWLSESEVFKVEYFKTFKWSACDLCEECVKRLGRPPREESDFYPTDSMYESPINSGDLKFICEDLLNFAEMLDRPRAPLSDGQGANETKSE